MRWFIVIMLHGVLIAGQDDVTGRQLIQASGAGCIVRCRQLLDQGVSPAYQNEYGLSALHAAAISAHYDICELLLSYDTHIVHLRVHETNYEPLIYALHEGHTEIGQLLLRHGAFPLVAYWIRTAVERAHSSCIPYMGRLLMDYGAPMPMSWVNQTGRKLFVQVYLTIHNAPLNPLDLKTFSHAEHNVMLRYALPYCNMTAGRELIQRLLVAHASPLALCPQVCPIAATTIRLAEHLRDLVPLSMQPDYTEIVRLLRDDIVRRLNKKIVPDCSVQGVSGVIEVPDDIMRLCVQLGAYELLLCCKDELSAKESLE